MRINVTKAVLLTIAGAALVFLPRRSSEKTGNQSASNQDVSLSGDTTHQSVPNDKHNK